MIIYNVNQKNKTDAINKTLAVQLNLLMYGTHGILNFILHSVKKYIACASDDNKVLMAYYFDIICVQTMHLLTLNDIMDKKAIFLPYERNTLCCFDEKRFKGHTSQKALIADTMVCQRLLLKNYKKLAQNCKNQKVKQLLQEHASKNQQIIYMLKQKNL